MLLELLNHHEDLFMAAIRPLICARKAVYLAALSATCRRLRDFLVVEVPIYIHYKLFNNSLKNIKRINIINNKYLSIREYDGNLHIYRYIRAYLDYTNKWRESRYAVWDTKKCKYYWIEYDNKIKTFDNHVSNIPICIQIVGEIPTWVTKCAKLCLVDYIMDTERVFYTA